MRRCNNILDNIYIENLRYKLLNTLKKKKRNKIRDKNIYLFCTPLHSNIGDQAQLLCWLNLFTKKYPEYKIVCIPAFKKSDDILEAIKNTSADEDLFFIHSGYLVYDPHPELPFICEVVNKFHDRPIIILPQTINLTSESKITEVSNCFNAHSDLTVICRDEISLCNANKLFANCTRIALPDVVTTLIGNNDYQFSNKDRKGILFCIRNDGEKLYTKVEIDELKKRFSDVKIIEKDTSVCFPKRCWNKKREKIVKEMIEEFTNFQLVITDRFHGVIFSQIANTPVIVINSADHKLSSGVKWFPKNLFNKNVYYAQKLDDAYIIAKDILHRTEVYINPPYFIQKYYHFFFE